MSRKQKEKELKELTSQIEGLIESYNNLHSLIVELKMEKQEKELQLLINNG